MTDTEIIAIIREAMLDTPPRMLVFDYKGKDGVPRMREAEPYKMDQAKRMVFCHCRTAEDVRWFKFDKIDNLNAGDTFKPRMTMTIPC